MINYAILCYIILFYIVLYYMILYDIILYYIVLFYYFIILYHITLHYIISQFIILYYVVIYDIILYYIMYIYICKYYAYCIMRACEKCGATCCDLSWRVNKVKWRAWPRLLFVESTVSHVPPHIKSIKLYHSTKDFLVVGWYPLVN